MNREEKIKIVINNYFKDECSVNTSIREAFEKGFRIGASKVQKKHGKWIYKKINEYTSRTYCSKCGESAPFICVSDDYYGNRQHGETIKTKFCPNCGADMRGEEG